jgi:vWA-MoxR associated protein C-terminal domain/Effector-associated domain 9
MAKDPLLDFYQSRLDDLEQDYNKVKEQRRVEQDGATQNKLDRQIEQFGQEMRECQQKIDAIHQDQQRQTFKQSQDALLEILSSHADQLPEIIQAYQKTLSHWSVSVNAKVTTIDAILIELGRIPPRQLLYSAQLEWIAHIIQMTKVASLIQDLVQWGQRYQPDLDFGKLYSQIQMDQDKRLENAQPALLIKLTRSDEASTQSQEGETYYEPNAWLIEDIPTYLEQKRQGQVSGCHALISSGSSEAQLIPAENLLETLANLIKHLLVEKRSLCPSCLNVPQIHVFLPLDLMDLAIDFCQINDAESRRPDYLGHDHIVVVRCSDHYQRNYRKYERWLQLWGRYERLQTVNASQVFVPGHDQDLDDLMDLLDETVLPEDSEIVGLQVKDAPHDLPGLLYELLDAGVPLALWPRQNLADATHQAQLSELLEIDSVERLPRNVCTKRYETRQRINTPDCHIGHHLALLWDDPYLVPPKSA